ncbi:MAG: hypothetical protein P4L50_16665 [Anaerolineaceae bacterium]|nr:hypothetical protein [Anaerolineaceae bacterium]
MLLTLKLVLSPLFIASVTLVGRRWGPGVGGWLMAFPLISGPISILLALQNGPIFAVQAAVGTMQGQTSVCLFCLSYSLVSRKARWPLSLSAAISSFLVATFLWDKFHPALLPTIALDLVILALVLWIMPGRTETAAASIPPKWDLPTRMLLAALFVLVLTTAANGLGPQLSGLISPFPVFSSIIAPFTHIRQGSLGVGQLLRGVVLGTFGLLAFYLVIYAMLPGLPVGWCYLMASAVAIVVNIIALRFVRQVDNPLPA